MKGCWCPEARGNRLNPCMLLHAHCKKTDERNMIEIAKEFIGDNQAKVQTVGRFWGH